MVSDVAVEIVERPGSGGSHVHGDWDCVATGSAAGCGGAALDFFVWKICAATFDQEPQQSDSEIHEINVGKLAVGAFRNRIEIAHEREQHGEAREPGENL